MKQTTKKLVMVLFMALMTVAMAACGNSEEKAESRKDGEGLKIAIVTSLTGVDDGNFNENNYNGILALSKITQQRL